MFEFVFEIAEAAGGSIGHYRHGTYVTGRLLRGTIPNFGTIEIPTTIGACPARMLVACTAGEDLSFPLNADSLCDVDIVLGTWRPAVPRDIVIAGAARDAVDSGASTLQIFQQRPEIFLHYQSAESEVPLLCSCADALRAARGSKAAIRAKLPSLSEEAAKAGRELLQQGG